MSKSVLKAFYLACLASITQAGFENSTANIAEFTAFSAQFNKQYVDIADANKHMENFLRNKARIEAKNAKNTKARFQIDSFADLSDEEFLKQKTGAHFEQEGEFSEGNRRNLESTSFDISSIQEVDWTHKMTAVKNQKNCGTCWAFAATSQLEAIHAIQYDMDQPVRLSEQEAVDCASASYAVDCNSGGRPLNYFEWASEHGSQRYNDYPYEVTMNDECMNQEDKWVVSKPTDWSKCGRINCDNDRVFDVAEALKAGPVIAGVNGYCLMGYSDGVLSRADFDPDSDCPDGNVINNHAIVLVGIKEVEGTLSWVFQNSWGTNAHDNGFGYIAIEDGGNFAQLNQYYFELLSVTDYHLKQVEEIQNMLDENRYPDTRFKPDKFKRP